MALQHSLNTDVLVIGGGMAGAWAALGAVRTGARVTLVDKGYCGTSGVTATAGPGHWWVPPAEREQAVRQRAANAGGLAEASWMRRIIETTWPRWHGTTDFLWMRRAAPSSARCADPST